MGETNGTARRRGARVGRMAGVAMLVGVGGVCVAAGPTLLPKQIVAPPEDVLSGVVRLPDPALDAVPSRHALMPVWFSRELEARGGFEWSTGIPVGDASRVRMALVAPAQFGAELRVVELADLTKAGGAPIRSSGRVTAKSIAGQPNVEVLTFDALTPRTRTLMVAAHAKRSFRYGQVVEPFEPFLIIAMDSPHALRSYVTTRRTLVGEEIGVVASMESDPGAGATTVTHATVRIESEFGGRTIELFDDGLHRDGAAGDGVFGNVFVPESSGRVLGRVWASGVTDEGSNFVRTAELAFDVIQQDIGLLRGVAAHLGSDDASPGTLRLDIPLWNATGEPARRVVAAAEIWGADPATGQAKPACWAAMVTEGRLDETMGLVASLYVDERWLVSSEVAGPYEIRHTRVQCAETFVVLDEMERAGVVLEAGTTLPATRGRSVDRAMLTGQPRPDLALRTTLSDADIARATAARAFGAHNLMLVHGYCAAGSPWPPGDFSGFTEAFSDPDANRTHDQFAQLIFALGNGSKSYGIVAHSQGGMAALHLWNYYFSGLDWATGPRLIQSLGSPYQGTPLASLGGFSCGVNNDMTPAGATAWLANIPTASRDDVYYWTTQHSGSWCNFLANFVLSTPNDGVIEVARGQLPGANNMGNTVGWCHTTGMSDPAQYTDSARNAEMNTNAAR